MGKKIILFFYPKDNTPGCTEEACSLRDGYSKLKQKGYLLLGVSPDSYRKHQNFIKKHTLPFSLISDVNSKMNIEFGLWIKKKLWGHEYMGTNRTTYILNEKGVITHIINDVDTADAAEQVLETIGD